MTRLFHSKRKLQSETYEWRMVSPQDERGIKGRSKSVMGENQEGSCSDLCDRHVSCMFLTTTINLVLKLQFEEYGLCKHELSFADNITEVLKED